MSRPRNGAQRRKKGGRVLWWMEDLIPTMKSRVRGPGPGFKSRYRGVTRAMVKVAIRANPSLAEQASCRASIYSQFVGVDGSLD